MSALPKHLEFAPPPPEGTARSVGAALFVHALLIVALTAGIQWQQDNSLSVEAELWSAVPMAAAPKLVEVEPPPPPPPPPAPKPEPTPKVVAKPAPPIAPNRDAEIALAKKKKIDEEKKLEAKREEDKRKEDLKKAEEKKAKLKAEDDKRKLEAKKEEERKDKERKDKERAEKERKEKEAKKQQEQKDSKAAAEEAKKLDAIRKENMKRMAGLAGATGGENATGTAMKASGPSDSYGGRIRARIKPNITFDDSSVAGNPSAEVEVRCAPDGTIVSRKLVKSSGNSAWDNAVLKAIDKTEVLPRDTDGRVHSPLLISFRPKD